jgi:multicomponent Na+:H+ antiporter subunit G
MNADLVLEVLSWVLLLAGGFFVFVGGVGALRMPDFYTRMHAAGITDTLGTILVLTGVIVQAGLTLATIKLLAIGIFLMLTAPTAAYALANAARLSGLRPEDGAGRAQEGS